MDRMTKWLVGILDKEYKEEADSYYSAKSQAARKYKEGHPGCEYTIGVLVAIARVRKLSEFERRIKSLEVK